MSIYILLFLTVTAAVSGYQLGPLGVTFVTPDTVRVTFNPPAATQKTKTSLVVTKTFPAVIVDVFEGPDTVSVTSSTLSAVIDRASLRVSFVDTATQRTLLTESSRTVAQVSDMGNVAFAVSQGWATSPGEGIYGLGSFQNNFLEFREAPVQLVQFNTEDVNPFFVSTGGYGILWDMYSSSYLNQPSLTIPANATTFHADVSGRYYFHIVFIGEAYGGRHMVLLTVDGATVVNWIMGNTPNTLTGYCDLAAGDVSISIVFTPATPVPSYRLYYRGPGPHTVLSSSVEYFGIDYYFGRSPDGSLDGAISQYRELTGDASLYPLWVYGFWQCKEHYHSQSEILAAAAEFRSRNLPIDVIVQDWQYWGSLGWGPHWDPAIFPDPKGMVDTLHAANIRIMVSVWSRFDPSTTFYKALLAAGLLIPNTTWFDPYSPDARKMFYSFSNASMFSIGVDSLWLDATEPEGFPNIDQKLSIGSGNAYMNPFALMVTSAVRDGLVADYPNRRVFSLTRSTFAGQQRTGGCLWTGDTDGTWDTLQRQVTSSLNYQLSGNPCWAQDIGGFFRPSDQYTSPDYHNLLVRWFQFGVFTPVFRVHGGGSNTEYWNYGPDVLRRVLDADNLRYRLLPYVYSLALNVTLTRYTMQRALVFDFPSDPVARTLNDEFMFGPSLLIAPVTTNATERDVYFPDGAWVDFHTGEVIQGPGVARRSAPHDVTPIYGRGGTLLLMGPYLNYTTEKPQNVTEVRVFRGGGAVTFFTMLEDDGQSADALSTGAFTATQLSWDDAACVLTIARREGSYHGMLLTRVFNIVLVRAGAGVGIAPSATIDATLRYTGEQQQVSFDGQCGSIA